MDFLKKSREQTDGGPESAPRDSDALLKRLEARSLELDEQAVELIARRAELDTQRRRLTNRQEFLDQRNAALDEKQNELLALRKQITQQTQALRDEHEQALAAVAQRMEGIRQKETELERRMALARDDLVRQRTEADELRATAERQAEETGAEFRRMEAERAGWSKKQAELQAWANERMGDLVKREAALKHGWGEIESRQAGFDRQRAELNEITTQHQRAAEAVKAREAGFGQREAELAARESERSREIDARGAAREGEIEARVAAREAELTARGVELDRRIARARDEAVRQREEIEQLREAAQARFDETEDGFEKLRAAEATWESRVAVLRSRAEELDGRAATQDQTQEQFDKERARIDAKDKEFSRARHELESQKSALERERAELNKGRGELAEQGKKLQERNDELDSRQRAVEQQKRDADAQRQKLDGLERSARENEARIKAELTRLGNLDNELNQRRAVMEAGINAKQAAIQAAQSRLDEYERTLDERRTDLDAKLDDTEARDAEIRQKALSLELQAEELEKRQAAIDFGQEELSGLRAEREKEFAHARTALDRRESRISSAEASVLTAPVLWWARATGIAATAAVIVMGLWLLSEPAEHRAAVRVALTTTTPYLERALREHAAAVISTEALSWLKDSSLARAWQSACREGRVGATFATIPPAIDITLRSDDAGFAEQLAIGVGAAYVEHINSITPVDLLPAAYTDVNARLSQAMVDLKTARDQRAEAATLLALCPPATRRDELVAQVKQLREGHALTVKALEAERARLATVQSDGSASGVLDETEFARVLAADAAYQADLSEFQSAARLYRSELSVSMVPLVSKLDDLEAALKAFALTIADQQGQLPPRAISAALEECASGVEGYQQAMAGFRPRWNEWRGRVEQISVDQDVAEVMQQQTVAAEAAEEFVQAGLSLMRDLDGRIGKLNSAGGGGTREVVIVAALRSGFNHLRSKYEQMAQSAKIVSRSDNFRLDAQDTRVRGLRTSLTARRDLIREGMQRQADRLASQDRESVKTRGRGEVNRLESEREALATQMVETMDALRGLDRDVLERRQLESDIARDDKEIARLETQVGFLQGQLAEAQRLGPQPDRAAMMERSVTQIAGANRMRNAATAGLATFGGMWGLCTLMILKNPLGRKRPGRPAVVAATDGEVGKSPPNEPVEREPKSQQLEVGGLR